MEEEPSSQVIVSEAIDCNWEKFSIAIALDQFYWKRDPHNFVIYTLYSEVEKLKEIVLSNPKTGVQFCYQSNPSKDIRFDATK